MSLFARELKPVSIVAFTLTCFGCLLTVLAISLTSWWSVNSGDARTYHGVWSRQDCWTSGICEPGSGTRLQSGYEAMFISKVFATFTVILSMVAVVLHVIYAIISRSSIRTATIFMLGSAALFGLLAVFVFLGFYCTVDVGTPSIGAAFYLFFISTLVCIAAAAFTAWASVRKASAFRLHEDENK